jgi:hypothetical protein
MLPDAELVDQLYYKTQSVEWIPFRLPTMMPTIQGMRIKSFLSIALLVVVTSG